MAGFDSREGPLTVSSILMTATSRRVVRRDLRDTTLQRHSRLQTRRPEAAGGKCTEAPGGLYRWGHTGRRHTFDVRESVRNRAETKFLIVAVVALVRQRHMIAIRFGAD